MLSSRYLYLHEALGLGPMWLKRGAHITASTADITPATAPENAATSQPQPTPASAPDLAKIKSTLAQKVATPAAFRQPEPKTPPAVLPEHIEAQAAPLPDVTPATAVVPAKVMIVSICPATEDLIHGALFYGKVGELLDKMLAAIDLDSGSVHKTSWLKTVLFQPSADELQNALPQLQAECCAAQPQAILFLGKSFQHTEHAEIFRCLHNDIPAFIIPHPARLLSEPHLKADAWQELKRLRATLQA